MKAHCSLRNNFNSKRNGRLSLTKVFPVYSLPLTGEWKKVELDELLLSSGRLQVHQLRAWLPDGALIDTQVSDITPEPRELNSAALSQTDSIVLALPLLQQGIINVQKKGAFLNVPFVIRKSG